MKAALFARLEEAIEKCLDKAIDEESTPNDFWWPEKLVERMTQAAAAVFDSAVESQQDMKANT